MENLTLIIPAKLEAESLPIFLKELAKYNCKKIIVLDKDDTSTINAIKEFTEVEILLQKQTKKQTRSSISCLERFLSK